MRIVRRGETLVLETPAKINLFLEVCGRRVDGYHDLRTVMLAVSLTDTLHVRPSPSGALRFRQHLAGTFHADDGRPPEDDRNLVVRAARRLAETVGVPAAAEIELWKRIPWQAGLGGGSSDAAAVLLMLNRLWDLQLPWDELHSIAATLGSDLNFFVAQSPLALCSGRGEDVTAQPLRRRLSIVIAQPAGGLSTAEVFRHWRPSEVPACPATLLRWLAGDSHPFPASGVYNGLQGPAERLHSDLLPLQRRMSQCGLTSVAMTGSGSACFGLARSDRHASRAAQRLRNQPGWGAWAVRPWIP